MRTKFTPHHENSKILPIESRFSIVKLNIFTNNRKQKNKNWFLKILILVSMITFSQIIFAQSKGWVMAPYYTKNINGSFQKFLLPIPNSQSQPQINDNSIDYFYPISQSLPKNYHGQSGKSIGSFDDQGNLVLFMVDNNLYDSEGYFVANSAGFHYFDNGNNVNPILNDQFIINVPGSCNKYYIGSTYNSDLLAPADIPRRIRHFGYSLIEIDQPNPFFPNQLNRKGKLTAIGETASNNYFLATEVATLKYSGEYYGSFFGISSKIPNTKNYYIFFGENILLVDDIGIHKVEFESVLGFNSFFVNENLKMGNSSIAGNTALHEGSAFTSGLNIHKEIEFYPTPTGFKVAYPVTYSYGITCPPSSQFVFPNGPEPDDNCFNERTFIAISNFNYDGSINGETRVIGFPLVNDGDNRLNENEPVGFEFSIDGNKIFVTSSNNSETDTDNPLYFFDLNNIGISQTHLNFTFESLVPINSYPDESTKQSLFNNFIEKDMQGSLVLVGEEGPKYKFTNSNSVSESNAPNWGTNSINPSINYQPIILELAGGNGSYFLAAQPDFGTLFESFDLSQPGCCAKWVPEYKRELTSNSLDIFIPPNGNTELLLGGANINGTVTIGSNANIILNNQTINFGPNGKIILEENSTFVSNNCTFKSIEECPVLWKGFEVHGNNRIDQADYSAELILNNSTISDATKGIAVSKLLPDGNPVLNTGSGIVKATNSNFENNYIDVEFYPYSPILYGSYTPTSLLNNLSFFKTCNFYTNLPVLKDNQRMPYAHVKMNNVRNISFKKCNFYNSNIAVDFPQNYGYGILSIDAQLKIGEYNSDSYTPPNTFVNLYQGIAAYGSSTFNSSTIINNRFENCRIGILTGGLFNSVISKNTFKNYLDESPVLPILSGNSPQIFEYFSNSVIDDNTFTNYNSSSSNSNAILIKNNTDIANYTNLNKFNNFATAQYFKGFTPAFKFRCNQNQNNQLDVLNATNSTISNVQGENNPQFPVSAANQFTQGASLNLQNDGNTFTYVFNSTTPFETPVTAGDVILNDNPTANSLCNPLIENYVWNGGGNPGGFITKLELANTHNAQLIGIVDAISYVKDGGNTDSLLAWANKELSISQQNQYVSNLLSLSPNVSSEVLLEVATATTISTFDKIAILAANPKAGGNKTILDTLSKISNPLGQAAINYIRNGKNNFSFLQYLEDIAVNKELERNVVLQNLFLELQLDSLGLDSTKMHQVLNVYHNPQAKVEQAYWALQNNNFELADATINNNNITYSSQLSEELEGEMFWINQMIELYSNQKNPYSLNKTEKDIIRDFAQNHNNKAATQAKGFMQYFYNENLIDGTNNSARIAQYGNSANEQERDNNLVQFNSKNVVANSLLISPNPAKDFVNIQVENINQDIVITDTNGKLIKSIKANASSIKIDVSDIKPGLYFVRFDSHHKKFVVER